MRVLLFTVAIALLGAALGNEDVPTEENVLVLSKANFDSVVSSTNYVLVEFCKFTSYLLIVLAVTLFMSKYAEV